MQGNVQIKADAPSPTIRAEHHGNIEGYYRSLNMEDPEDMKYWRRLTVRECARLQTFLMILFSKVQVHTHYKMIGNTVPPVLGWNMAQAIQQTLDNAMKKVEVTQ